LSLAEPVPADIALLSRLRLFSCLRLDDLCEISCALKRRSYARGEVIYHQDDPPGNLFIIARGSVKMQASSATGRQITIAWLREGHFFGTINLASDTVRPENAIALEPSDLLVLPRDEYRAFLQRHPQALDVLLEVLASRWRHALGRLCDMACLDVPGRIAKILVDFAPTFGEPEPDGSVVIRHMTQPELAALVGATRESVHSALHTFARHGWIEFQRGSVRILQEEGLRRRIVA
jgi:CRP/FNR family cyclic AMP-dependent transcriptional regulator